MTVYLAADGFLPELLRELETVTSVRKVIDRLVFTEGAPVQATWAQNTWLNPMEVRFGSIREAAEALKGIQRNWALFSVALHRRAKLIEEKLPSVKKREFAFPEKIPGSPMGSWTLLEEGLLVSSPACTSPLPNGEIHFVENRTAPPSRAYLKLWEALTLAGIWPGPGEVCIDMGSSPGGWTWALQGLGAEVISVDRAPLADAVLKLPRVRELKHDAFTLDPKTVGPVDWFFSDVICYPGKLYELVEKWRLSGVCKRFVCTIKFQGKELDPSDLKALQAFQAIPGSSARHLFHNKHELTWMKL